MKFLGRATRRKIIEYYIRTDASKEGTPSPPTSLDFEDPNALDIWFIENGYKSGVITGFRSWARVCLSLTDLRSLAVVEGIFTSSRVLGRLLRTTEFDHWKPNRNPYPIWYTPLSQGDFDDDFTIILRAATPGEGRDGAKLYVEDGSGRSICYTRAIQAKSKQSKMKALIGFDPDPHSIFLGGHLEREFASKAAQRYSSFERMIETTGVALEG